MILNADLIKKIDFVVETPDEYLPLFPAMERCVIIALKKFVRNEREAADDVVPNPPTANKSRSKSAQVEIISL